MAARSGVGSRQLWISLLAMSLVGWQQLGWALAATPQHVSTNAPQANGGNKKDQEDEQEQPEDEVVVISTRSQVLMKDEPIHVEAVPAEEIEENLTEAPGSVSTVFLELPGMHVESAA